MNDLNDQVMPKTKVKGIGDVVILVDTTSSMNYCVDTLKKTIGTLFEKLNEPLPDVEELDYRIKIVPYVDISCDTDKFPTLKDAVKTDNPFVKTQDEVEKQLNGIKIEQYIGGDPEETTFEAIYLTCKETDWREEKKGHRVIVVFTNDGQKFPFTKERLTEKVLKNEDENVILDKKEDVINFLAQILTNMEIRLFIYAPDFDEYNTLCDFTANGKFCALGPKDDKKDYFADPSFKNQLSKFYTELRKTMSSR